MRIPRSSPINGVDNSPIDVGGAKKHRFFLFRSPSHSGRESYVRILRMRRRAAKISGLGVTLAVLSTSSPNPRLSSLLNKMELPYRSILSTAWIS